MHHLLVDHKGVPLAVTLAAANVHDSQMLGATVDAVHSIKCPRGRLRKRPAKLHADKGCDYPISWHWLRRGGMCPSLPSAGSSPLSAWAATVG
jgi:hypothetical protein